jgi:Fe2+-dicitrate sensor, membrane component
MANNAEIEFYDLMGLKLSGDATPEQLERLQQLMNEFPEFMTLYTHIENAGRLDSYPIEILEQSYASHYVKKRLLAPTEANYAPITSGKKHSFKIRNYFKYAAVLILLPLVGLAVYNLYEKNNTKHNTQGKFKNEVATEKGSKSKIMLPDSTMVILNSDSRLTYDEHFNKQSREVVLTGEAYFDVKYNKEKPFIIHTDKTKIKVLGTAFNVRNYPQEDIIETSLIRGKIELTFDDKKDNRVILNPSEKIIISKKGLSQNTTSKQNNREEDIFKLTRIVAEDSTIAELAWINNELYFVNKPLDLIARELERVFNTTIIFKNDVVKHYRYTIHSSNYNLEEILQIIKHSQNINYRFISKDTLIIE